MLYLNDDSTMKEDIEFNQKIEKVVKIQSRKQLYDHLTDLRGHDGDPEGVELSATSRRWWSWLIPLIILGGLLLMYSLYTKHDSGIDQRIDLALNEIINRDIDNLSDRAFITDRKEEDTAIKNELEKLRDGHNLSDHKLSLDQSNYLLLLKHIKTGKYHQAKELLVSDSSGLSRTKNEILLAIILMSTNEEKGKIKMKSIADQNTHEYADLAKSILGHE